MPLLLILTVARKKGLDGAGLYDESLKIPGIEWYESKNDSFGDSTALCYDRE